MDYLRFIKYSIIFHCFVLHSRATQYLVGKYLSELLNLLTHNDYSLKDSFDAVTRNSRILLQVRENDEYMFILLDVDSLFTNVPLKKTINITQITTSLSKHPLKKLILHTCQKTAFSFNNKMYEQLDGVSTGGSLGLVLANIIMTECEKIIVDK